MRTWWRLMRQVLVGRPNLGVVAPTDTPTLMPQWWSALPNILLEGSAGSVVPSIELPFYTMLNLSAGLADYNPPTPNYAQLSHCEMLWRCYEQQVTCIMHAQSTAAGRHPQLNPNVSLRLRQFFQHSYMQKGKIPLGFPLDFTEADDFTPIYPLYDASLQHQMVSQVTPACLKRAFAIRHGVEKAQQSVDESPNMLL